MADAVRRDSRAGGVGDDLSRHLAAREGFDGRAGVSGATRYAAARVLHSVHLSVSVSVASGPGVFGGRTAARRPRRRDARRRERARDHGVRNGGGVYSAGGCAEPVCVRCEGDWRRGGVRGARWGDLLAGTRNHPRLTLPRMRGSGSHCLTTARTPSRASASQRRHATSAAWHGGEAKKARDAVLNLSSSARAALIKFLESL